MNKWQRKNLKKNAVQIANTPITMDCFDMEGFDGTIYARNKETDQVMKLGFYWEGTINFFDILRCKYLETKNERIFNELVRLLPNSYKVVKLC